MTLSQHVQPHRKPAPIGIVASVMIAALGGFVGGLLIEHGPTYLNVHVTQPMLSDDAELAELVSVAPAEPPLHTLAIEPADLALEDATPLPDGAEARVVIHSDIATYLVMQTAASAEWGTGPLRSSSDDGMVTTLRQSVNASALAESQRAWKGSPVTLYDAEGYACSGRVESIELLEQFAGDGMTRDAWDEYANGPLLAARITSTQGDCKSAEWARHADLPAPSMARIDKGTTKARNEARRAFRASNAYQQLQSRYRDEGNTGPWDTFWDNELTVRFIHSPGQELVFVEAQVGGCGDFDGQLGVVFARQEDGSLLALPSENTFVRDIAAAADVDGDGDLDLVTRGDGFDRSLMLQVDSELEHTSHSEVGIYFCRC